jgi:hypothetical protein
MTARIDEVQHYEAAPEEVFAMLSDDEFIVHKSMRSGSLDVEALVEEDQDIVTIVNHRVMPAKVPGFVKRFLGDTIPMAERQEWGPVHADGSRHGQFWVEFGGQPLHFAGTVALRPDGAGAAVQTKGDIKCTVPFLGGRIEKFAAEWIGKYLNKEQRVGAQWLADQR